MVKVSDIWKKGAKHPRLRDLGLTYLEAVHGVQCAIGHGMNEGKTATEPKHMRTGVDMQKADMLGLAMLLIDKGIITGEEYNEYMRLAANEELAMREDEYGGRIKFR